MEPEKDEIQPGLTRRVLKGHTSVVLGCTVDPKGQWIVSASSDQTLRVWDVATLREEESPIPSVQYTNAQVALVGDSGVGKTRLGIRAFLDRFLKKKRPLIPVILPRRKGNPRLPIILSQFQAVDFRKEDPDLREQLIWGITGERGLR